MRLVTKLTLSISVVLFLVFLFGVSPSGQTWLLRNVPRDISHEAYENEVIGAEITPWVFGFLPSFTAALAGSVLYLQEKGKPRQ